MRWRLLNEKNEVCDIEEIPPEAEEDDDDDEKLKGDGHGEDLGPVD